MANATVEKTFKVTLILGEEEEVKYLIKVLRDPLVVEESVHDLNIRSNIFRSLHSIIYTAGK